ncbi:MAG: preprotein translocase subunit SecE [Phototrophicaceae bacterium]
MATETKTKNENKSFIEGIRTYWNEVRTELQKVSWPSRDDVIRLTRIVLIVTAITSIGLGALSVGMTLFLDQFGFDYPLVMVVLFIAIAIGTWWSFQRGERKGY